MGAEDFQFGENRNTLSSKEWKTELGGQCGADVDLVGGSQEVAVKVTSHGVSVEAGLEDNSDISAGRSLPARRTQ